MIYLLCLFYDDQSFVKIVIEEILNPSSVGEDIEPPGQNFLIHPEQLGILTMITEFTYN